MAQRFDRKVILEDGTVYEGFGFGDHDDKLVELVFNTSMVGYQEILSDLSYTDQAVVMTYPLIGNYGICDEDYESDIPGISGMIVRNRCDEPSNFRCRSTLDETMKKYGIAGIYGIDTRELTRHIRDKGSCKALITDADRDAAKAFAQLQKWIPATDQVKRASTMQSYDIPAPSGRGGRRSPPPCRAGARWCRTHIPKTERGWKRRWQDRPPCEDLRSTFSRTPHRTEARRSS